jgi:hypothetical protein
MLHKMITFSEKMFLLILNKIVLVKDNNILGKLGKLNLLLN